MQTFYALGFDEIKDDLKNYIKNNSTLLKDYNFEGSAIAEMIGVLAYATQYQAFYLNMVANELFLSTAQLEKNIYKLATMLGYVPRRASAPWIVATISNAGSSTVSVDKYTNFTFGDANLVLMTATSIGPGASTTVSLHEGTIVQNTISIPAKSETTGYWIQTATTDTNIDFDSELQQYLKYNLADYKFVDNNFLYVYDKYSVTFGEQYWTQVNEENPEAGGKYYYLNYLDSLQIMFDNGDFFDSPQPLTSMFADYLLTNGTLYNNVISTIELADEFTGSTNLSVTTGTNRLLNGSDPETLNSIRANAPLFYTTNNRAVTELDWNSVVKKYSAYNIFADIVLWGGNNEFVTKDYQNTSIENNNYKDVGYVYMSGIKSNTATYTDARYDFQYLTIDEKLDLETFLIKYKILTLYFKFLDPNIIYFKPLVSAKLKTDFISSATVSYQTNEHLFNTYVGLNKTVNRSNITKYIDNLAEVNYCEVSLSTHVRVLNDSSYMPTSLTASFFDNRVTYEDWKVIRFGDTIEQDSLNGYIVTFETLTDAATIYNNSNWISGTHTGTFLDNNYIIDNVVATTGPWYGSIILDSGSTLSIGDVLTIIKDNVTLTTAATIAEINYLYDQSSTSTIGDIMLDSTTIGNINYELGFATIASTGTTLSAFTTYAFAFTYTDELHSELSREGFLSPLPISLSVI